VPMLFGAGGGDETIKTRPEPVELLSAAVVEPATRVRRLQCLRTARVRATGVSRARATRMALAAVSAATLTALLVPTPSQADPAAAVGQVNATHQTAASTTGPMLDRLGGSNRYATAVEISSAVWNDGAAYGKHVYIASGENFPDALAGGPAATSQGEPTAPGTSNRDAAISRGQ
jgi:hypothetical protein